MWVALRAALLAAGVALAGCTLVDIDKLIPTTAIDWVEPTNQLIVVNSCSAAKKLTITNGPLSYAAVSQRTAVLNAVLPDQIRSEPLVQAVMAHAQYVSAQSTSIASYVAQANNSGLPAPEATAPKITLTTQHFDSFARMVSNGVLRHTPSTPSANTTEQADAFWNDVKAYYKVYFDGGFKTYFGSALSQPTISNTIGDTEIVQAASVFMELLMDEIFHSPVWIGPDKKYYPGGNTNAPSLLSINNISATSIPSGLYGCGMNVDKANTIYYLAQAFTKAAETESNLSIKSFGGVEVGLGVLGKVSIGDNSTLTDLVQTLVSEIVGRLTVALAAPVLEAIDIEQQPALKAAVGAPPIASHAVTSKTANANVIRVLSTPFVSATAK